MLRLLVVDDEWLIRKGIVRMVQRLRSDWSVEEATSGSAAMDLIGEKSFDLVFCDIKMPKMNGIEMLDTLTQQGYRIPVVYITGYDEFSFMRNALRLRAYDYLLKPIHDSDVISILANFEKDFLNMKALSSVDYASLQQFEFRFLNVLDSLDPDKVSEVIDEGEATLGGFMSKSEYVNEVIRITNQFFSNYRVYGFDQCINISSNELSNLANIHHTIRIEIGNIKDMKGAEDNKIIQLAKKYIDSHVQDSATLSEVANHVHMNPTYFSEYFKEKSGETFLHYVNRIKIEKAKVLLRSPKIDIAYIAEYLGYTNPRSFSKMFKTHLGMTPTEYRNLHI